MENILLVLNIVFAIVLVLLVLMQKSEGGALRDWCVTRKYDVFKICW
jgi:protein translocase SecG subunit